MSNVTVGQIIMEVQRMASRVKDLDSLSSSLLMEAEGNNRLMESMRQFQDDMESLNRISNNKTNAEMVNRIQQQNANSAEILKENRELKICLEDYELAMEMIMKKYREHVGAKILDSKMNLGELQNENLWKIIREQREKINEMAAVMQRAASVDDDLVCRDLETMHRLRLENQTLRELLQISKQFGTDTYPIRLNEMLLEEKAVQTEASADDSAEDLSLTASLENANNNSVILANGPQPASLLLSTTDSGYVDNMKASASSTATVALDVSAPTDNAAPQERGENNNGPIPAATATSTPPATQSVPSSEKAHAATPSAADPSVTVAATAASTASSSAKPVDVAASPVQPPSASNASAT